MLYAIGIGGLSVALTLTGVVAALWHMAWWVGAVLLVMSALSAVLVMAIIAQTLPPESKAEQQLRRRYQERRNQSGGQLSKSGGRASS